MRYGKYGNRKTVVDGMVFDSRHEAVRYQELKLLERAGKITDLQTQVVFELIPAQYETYERYSEKTGKKLKDGRRCLERGCSYVADFVYRQDGEEIVEDAKGMRTEEYRIKRKLMLWRHGIKVVEV